MNNAVIKFEFILEEYQKRVLELEKEVLMLKAYINQSASEKQQEDNKE